MLDDSFKGDFWECVNDEYLKSVDNNVSTVWNSP